MPSLPPAADPFLAQLLRGAQLKLEPLAALGRPQQNQSFLAWCLTLVEQGLLVDGKPFRLADRPAMHAIYDAVPSTADEAYRYVVVLQKSAQVGFTVMEMLAALYMGLKFGAATVGLFMPDQQSAQKKSRERFMPVVRSIPAVHGLMIDAQSGRLQEGNMFDRRIGGSRFVYAWTSGRTATESTPMDSLFLDEVQEMSLEAIEKVTERLSASSTRFMMLGSTANWPDADINHWYRRGPQYRFHTRCPTCQAMAPLDEYFPRCIERRGRETYYVCKEGHRIEDPQAGEWLAHHPELEEPYDPSVPRPMRSLRIRSFHFPQTLSPTISPGELLDAYNSATNWKNFYNRKLGTPYVDPNQTPVTLEHLNACVAAGQAAGVKWAPRDQGGYMGIDQMGNFNVVWIKKRRADGRLQAVHVEEIYGVDPFARCAELMRLYGVRTCVVEINPNYNEAVRFAQQFPGRVYLCDSFGELEGERIQWSDANRLSNSQRRTVEEDRDRYRVRIDQFKCMAWSMSRFVRGECLLPDPLGLVQDVIDKASKQTAPVLPRAFTHFTKTALVVEKDEETNRFKRQVRKIGVDPHHSYANMLADVALARDYGTSFFLFPGQVDEEEVETSKGMTPLSRSDQAALPMAVVEAIEAAHATRGTCATCQIYPGAMIGEPQLPKGYCRVRRFDTKPTDPVCELFESID
jgi:hypothetical protein